MTSANALSRLVPITSTASSETTALYKWLLSAKKNKGYIVGVNDMIWGMPDTDPTPVIHGTEQTFLGITERWPGFLGMEYHDPLWLNRYGRAATNLVRTALVLAHARGSVIGLHNHPGNPVTGQMSRNGLSWRTARSSRGNYGDRDGSPVASLMTGGEQEKQFLDWLDRIAEFIASLIDRNGAKIPIIFRPFHEQSAGTWFWWNGEDRAADMVQVWRKMVDYLRNEKGLTNVLYCWNVNVHRNFDFTPYWPGTNYVDLISIDIYDNRNSPEISFDGEWTRKCYDILAGLANATKKPLMCSELGYQFHVEQGISDIWDVRTGEALAQRYSDFGIVALWDRPWGPQLSNPAPIKDSLRRWIEGPHALTADRLAGIYRN